MAQLGELHTGRSAEGIKKQKSYKEIISELSNDVVSEAASSQHLSLESNETVTQKLSLVIKIAPLRRN